MLFNPQMVHVLCCILFSTVAFGMGVDIPDVQTVIHYGHLGNVESYVQERGQAARDEKQSRVILHVCVFWKSSQSH